MAKKKLKKKTRKRKARTARTTDWAQGLPLDFPKKKNPPTKALRDRKV